MTMIYNKILYTSRVEWVVMTHDGLRTPYYVGREHHLAYFCLYYYDRVVSRRSSIDIKFGHRLIVINHGL